MGWWIIKGFLFFQKRVVGVHSNKLSKLHLFLNAFKNIGSYRLVVGEKGGACGSSTFKLQPSSDKNITNKLSFFLRFKQLNLKSLYV